MTIDLLTSTDFEYFDFEKVHKFKNGKFVKYLDETGQQIVDEQKNVPPDEYVAYIADDWFDLLAVFTLTPFISENTLKKIVEKENPKSDYYIKLNNALYSLRSLGICSKYSYQLNRNETETVYVLNDCQPLRSVFPDNFELKKVPHYKAIQHFQRKSFLEWDNASRLFERMAVNQVRTRLYNFENRPILFFETEYGKPYGINFGYRIGEHNFISNRFEIPIFNFYFEDYEEHHDFQNEISSLSIDEPMNQWFRNFDFEEWKKDRKSYLDEQKEKAEFRRKHKILGRFFS